MYQDTLLLVRIVENTPIGIVVVTREGNIHYMNKWAEQLFKSKRDLLINRPIKEYVALHKEEISWEELWTKVINGEIDETTVVLEQEDGNNIMCKVKIFSLDNDAQNPALIAMTFRDITQEFLFTEQIEKKNLEMAKMNSELIRSNAELMRLSEMKSNFLSIASHELKTPLTSIKGYSDIIIDNMREQIDENIYHMIESINRAADRLHRVVNNILDVTRIEQKKLRLKPEMLDLRDVAKDCIEELKQFSQKRGIVFNCQFQENLPLFYGDKMRMQQVFTNLFSNAIKYSPDNSCVEVIIETEKKEENERFHIAVCDHGVGIDKSEQKNIFLPFYEVGKPNRHSTDFAKFMGGGTGLGLSIVKGIIERHGGRIWVESPGVKENEFPGSTFHIILPIKAEIGWDDDETKTILIEERKQEEAINIEDISKISNEKPVLLFIDSDREAVEIAKMVLENAFEIITAESGEIGLSLAFSRHPSIILLDSYLPGIDGYKVCRILKSLEETRNIPIAFFSAQTQNEEIKKCFSSGADDFIVKPFNGRELVDKIWRLLMKKKEENTFK
ncbi:MAG: ATP-binding protein [Chitinispirillaceae bacterium]|nr:ATP-binding protein [Chitinispirillaceae bacterium]